MDNVAKTSQAWTLYGRETPHGTRYGLFNNAGADTGAQFPDAGAAAEYARTGSACKRVLAAIALAVAATGSNAGELSLQAHGVSYHFTRDVEYNERNAGAGIRYAFDRTISVQAGAFNNSHSRISFYALADWTPLHVGAVSAGAFAGAATGYQWRPMVGVLTPIAGAVIRAGVGQFNVAVRITPPHPKASAVAALEIGVRF